MCISSTEQQAKLITFIAANTLIHLKGVSQLDSSVTEQLIRCGTAQQSVHIVKVAKI